VTRDLGLSLGDRACLAVGRLLGMPVLTADAIWSRLSLDGLEVELLR
jgi:PIN domain nuclease of toxin-antitoxin system